MMARTTALMAAMRFTEADLEANRKGDLSSAQMQRMASMRRRHTLVAAALFLALVISATALIYAGQINDNRILSLAGISLILANAALVGMIARSYMRMGSDLRAGNVEVLKGEVLRVLRRGGSGASYLLRVDGAELDVNREVFQGFQHESPYRIYRTRHAGLLLSAEPIV